MRKLLKTKHKPAGFPVIFYQALRNVLLLLGMLLIFTGFFLGKSFFLKFTINSKLTDEALSRIVAFKIFLVVLGLITLAFILLMHFYKNNMLRFITRKKVLFQSLALLFLTICIVTITLELSIRIILPKEAKYSLPAGADEFSEKYVFLNREGYRDSEHAYGKGKTTVRIAVLGDSFAFGSGIKNANDTYPKELEKMLNSKSIKFNYEVLNFGKPGIDTEFEIKILKNDALRYDPDIIIVGYVLNDFRDIDYTKAKKSSNIYLFWLDIYLQRYSYLYHFTNKGFNAALEAAGFKKSYYRTIVDSFNSENNKEFNKEYFKELKDISKNNNATLIIVIFPFIYKLDGYQFAVQHRVVAQSGEEYGIAVLDLLPYFRNLDEKQLVVSRYDNHPNEIGHQIAADAIYEKLIKLKLAP